MSSSGPSLKIRALGFLARREHSRLELEKKLASYAPTPEELSFVLDSLEQHGLLSAGRMVEPGTQDEAQDIANNSKRRNRHSGKPILSPNYDDRP